MICSKEVYMSILSTDAGEIRSPWWQELIQWIRLIYDFCRGSETGDDW